MPSAYKRLLEANVDEGSALMLYGGLVSHANRPRAKSLDLEKLVGPIFTIISHDHLRLITALVMGIHQG